MHMLSPRLIRGEAPPGPQFSGDELAPSPTDTIPASYPRGRPPPGAQPPGEGKSSLTIIATTKVTHCSNGLWNRAQLLRTQNCGAKQRLGSVALTFARTSQHAALDSSCSSFALKVAFFALAPAHTGCNRTWPLGRLCDDSQLALAHGKTHGS